MFCKVKINNYVYNSHYISNNKTDKQPLILLHGWGVDGTVFDNIFNELDYYVIAIDFIGFGKSDEPIVPFCLDDYVSQLEQTLNYLNLKNVILLGHSFGGRVAIKYNYYYNVNKLILTDSAGIRNVSFKLYKDIYKYKFLKKLYFITNKQKYEKLINNSGSRDYKLSSPIMKQTMNKVIREDVLKYCKQTRTKVLILWGCHDLETPLNDGYKFYQTFHDSRLIIFYKSSHFPFLDEKEKYLRIVNSDNYD